MSRLTAAQLRAARTLYENGWTIAGIAHQSWERLGFPSVGACRMSLQRAFIACGYRRRSKREAALLRHHGRPCAGCGCHRDERTRGCATCKVRHSRRKKRGDPYVPLTCTRCGIDVDSRTRGCRTCSSRHHRRRCRDHREPADALTAALSPSLRSVPSAAGLPSGGGLTPLSEPRTYTRLAERSQAA